MFVEPRPRRHDDLKATGKQREREISMVFVRELEGGPSSEWERKSGTRGKGGREGEGRAHQQGHRNSYPERSQQNSKVSGYYTKDERENLYAREWVEISFRASKHRGKRERTNSRSSEADLRNELCRLLPLEVLREGEQ